tara:strand:- start:163 stop:729 length:567 start_codon:yes stop_codon:yes gene_type:complete
MTPNFYSLSKSLRHHENLTAGGGDSGSMSATGATETTYTDSGTEYTVQTWTSSGSFDITGTLTVDMLVVAGGGTGGWWYNGGAGGGAYTEDTSTVYDWTADDGSTADFKINGTGNSYAGGAGGGVQVGSGGSGGVGEDGTRVGGGGGDNNGVGSSTPVASTGSGGSSTGGAFANRSGASGVIIIRYPS